MSRLTNTLSMRLRSSLQETSFRKGVLLAFLVGFAVRLIPEILSYPYPIGFDTIYYAWRIKSGIVWYNWSQVFSTWLLYGLLIPVYNFVRGDPFLLLKVTAPLLFGLNTCGVYYFATRALSWTTRKSLLTAFLFSFQVAALAISWHFYRNMLGLGILLFALPWIKNGVKGWSQFVFLAFASVLVVWGHEYAAVILFVSALGVVLSDFLKGKRASVLKVLAGVSPAFALFLARMYFVFFPVFFLPKDNVVMSYRSVGHFGGLFSFFANYLVVRDTVQFYASYWDLALSVLSLFALLYAFVLPLGLIGFFRDRVLDSFTVLLLVGAFGALIVPFFALDLWSRWMLMLVYPFAFYAANCVAKASHPSGKGLGARLRWLSWLKLSARAVKALFVVSLLLGLVYMATPLLFGRAGVFGFPTTVSYVPSTMQCTTVPLVDVDGTVRSMDWLNAIMNDGSVLLAQDAFFYWARLYLDGSRSIVYFKDDVLGAISVAFQHGFGRVYFVWWNVNIGWYGLTVPAGFVSVFSSGRISVFEFVG